MSFLIGGALGSLIAMFLICLLIYKLGPKRRVVNFILQAIISGLITLYLSTDHYGTHPQMLDIAANWIGWVVALAIMLAILLRARSKTSPTSGLDQ